jgi:hypothetical protein
VEPAGARKPGNNLKSSAWLAAEAEALAGVFGAANPAVERIISPILIRFLWVAHQFLDFRAFFSYMTLDHERPGSGQNRTRRIGERRRRE